MPILEKRSLSLSFRFPRVSGVCLYSDLFMLIILLLWYSSPSLLLLSSSSYSLIRLSFSSSLIGVSLFSSSLSGLSFEIWETFYIGSIVVYSISFSSCSSLIGLSFEIWETFFFGPTVVLVYWLVNSDDWPVIVVIVLLMFTL